VRRFSLAAALAVLLTLVLAVPAVAETAKSPMPANDVLIAKALIRQHRLRADASPAQKSDAVQAYLRAKFSGGKELDQPDLGNGVAGATLLSTRTPWGRVVLKAPGTFVDNALVILVEFDPADYVPAGGDFAGQTFQGGPLHAQIPAPVAGDDTTFWPGDFSTRHYQKMLFGASYPIYNKNGKLRGTSAATMRSFYSEMSKGAYTVGGQIADWVKVPYPESWYGRDAVGTDDATGEVWRVVVDAVKALKAAHPDFDWQRYDRQNPYGIAGDDPGVPDGYVDHLILVHAGVDESAGGGAQGDDAIWAHSSWVDGASGAGPGQGGGYQVAAADGARPDGLWVGPYTINPEDGGIGVFCHEFGHDLGLPDEYDTTYLGDSPSAFWTLMDQGSWSGKKWGLGTLPTPMNAWDKWSLGFIDWKQRTAQDTGIPTDGKTRTFTIKPAAAGGPLGVAFRVDLPDATHAVQLSGADGADEWYSGQGDDLRNTLTAWDPASGAALKLDLSAATSPTLSIRTWYEMENGYDYGYVEASSDGVTWTTLAGTHTADDGSGRQALNGASGGGVAGVDEPAWETDAFDLSAFAGKQDVRLHFVYFTDSSQAYRGWEIADASVADGATSLWSVPNASGAGAARMGSDTWSVVDGGYTAQSKRYYVAEYRDRSGFDATLNALYNFSTDVNAEFFPYNAGLHLIYRDTFYADNNNGVHPGQGGWMVVDAHPWPDFKYGDVPWRSRVQVRDAAFSTKATKSVSLTPLLWAPEKVTLPGRAAQPVFDDRKAYWFSIAPNAGTQVDTLGVTIRVLGTTATGALKVRVHAAWPGPVN
jgi:immune inhibitor A